MKRLFLYCIGILWCQWSASQVLVGTSGQTPDPSAALEIKSNNRGLLLPRLTRSQIFAIANPAEGLLVYNTTNKQPAFFDGTAWRYFSNAFMTYPASGVVAADAIKRINEYRASGYRGLPAAPAVQWNDTLAYAMYKFAENKVLQPTGNAYSDNNGVSIFQYPAIYGYVRTVNGAARATVSPATYTVAQVIDLWMNDADISYAQTLMGANHKMFGIGRYDTFWYIILGQ